MESPLVRLPISCKSFEGLPEKGAGKAKQIMCIPISWQELEKKSVFHKEVAAKAHAIAW